MSIIEQIKAMPDDAKFFVAHDLGAWGKGVQGYGNTSTVRDLKALAESHERLLQLLKTRGNDDTTAEEGVIWTANVKAAITEAEALSK